MDVSKLLADLQASGVESFEGYGIKVSFHKRLLAPVLPSSNTELKETPPELKTDQTAPIDPGFAQSLEAEMNPDKALFWSVPSNDDTETPLTGDQEPVTSVS